MLAPIIVAPNWSKPFELTCDASGVALGAVLGQRREKFFHPIYYARKSLNDAQHNCIVREQEFLAVFMLLKNFGPTCWARKWWFTRIMPLLDTSWNLKRQSLS